MSRTVFRGRCVLPDAEREAAVVVDHGRITAIHDLEAWSPDPHATVVDLRADEVLLPGLVDTHVHVNEPGRTEWEGFETATRAAAAGGVTTIVDMPLNSIPPTTDLPALEVKRAAAEGKCYVDVGFWGGAVPTNLGGLGPLYDAGVFGFKCFLLDSGVAEFAPLGRAELDAAMAEVAAFDGLLIAHAEDAATIEAATVDVGCSYAAFVASRPPQAEDRAIAALIAAAIEHEARVHVVHLSNAGSLDRLARAKADGVRISVETCPHYLALEAELIEDGATAYKCCPPIRSHDNRERLWQGLADGVVDMVVSDHSPATPELKQPDIGDFGAAWGGIASLQLGLSVVWAQAAQRGHALHDVATWMATAPAAIVGVAGKGGIVVGHDADFAVFAPDETFVVDAARLHHRHPLTPYAGRTLRGVVRQTWLRGRPIAADGQVDPVPTGDLLCRGAQ
ncbi:MAG TPA: allantoinase AllB [Nocardioidaceae bacterium]|jgi:allantoinase